MTVISVNRHQSLKLDWKLFFKKFQSNLPGANELIHEAFWHWPKLGQTWIEDGPWGLFIIKTPSYQYSYYHYKDKASYIGKGLLKHERISSYWSGPGLYILSTSWFKLLGHVNQKLTKEPNHRVILLFTGINLTNTHPFGRYRLAIKFWPNSIYIYIYYFKYGIGFLFLIQNFVTLNPESPFGKIIFKSS